MSQSSHFPSSRWRAGIRPFLASLALLGIASGAPETGRQVPGFIPWPKQVELKQEMMSLASARFVAGSAGLKPLAAILAKEISAATGLEIPLAEGPAKAGDIVLSLDGSQHNESYSLTVGARAVASGGDYGSVANATVTLLQAISGEGDAAALPQMRVRDSPDKHYRGLMIDVARKYHSIGNLKQIVELCRFYKIRFLQLHLTDDQGFMFPTKAFPKVLKQNQNGGQPYTLDELTGLVAYADARNVTIVPEFDIPGHSAALNRSDPDFWMIRGTKPYEHHASINFAKDDVIEGCATIIGEMCSVFKSSPFFHIGGDEADYVFADQNADFQKAFKKLGLGGKGQHEMYRRFLVLMDAAVKKNGKRTIVWEGFGAEPDSKFPIPKDVIVMVYENRFYQPDNLVKDGYQIVNASWTPLYVMRVLKQYTRKIYDWNVLRFGAYTKDYGKTTWRELKPGPLVTGSQICSWEQPQAQEIGNLRLPLAAMSERVWNVGNDSDWPEFERRLASTDSILEKIIHTVHWKCEGLADAEERMFDKSFTLTMTSDKPGTIRYALDGNPPTAESPAYASPVTIDQSTFVRSALFDSSGNQAGPLTEDHFRRTKP